MATYAIGDIQGCYFSFQRLLQKIRFDVRVDKLWLVGDVVNRGSGSLETLRWLYEHQDQIVLVLGNHDLHTIAVFESFVQPHRSDTLEMLLNAPDSVKLIHWLRHQKMIHADQDYLMVHAGLLPQWTARQALALGAEVESAIRGSDYRQFFAQMYGNQPDIWSDNLVGVDRLRIITNAMTRLRLCQPDGRMDFKFKGESQQIPQGYFPWFSLAHRQNQDSNIIFGHWSALGLLQTPNLAGLDTGCLWGGKLTAMRLEDRAIIQVDCDARDSPRKIELAGD